MADSLCGKYADRAQKLLAESPENKEKVKLEGIGLILAGLDELILLTKHNQKLLMLKGGERDG